MFRFLKGMILVFLVYSGTLFAEDSEYADPQPTTCVNAQFSATGDIWWKSITLRLSNRCAQALDFQNVKVTFPNRRSINTSFWGEFGPLSYPDNVLQITSQASGSNYLASFTLHFPTYNGSNSILPVNASINIQYGQSSADYLGTANVYLASSAPTPEPGFLAIQLQTLPSELSGYTQKPSVQVIEVGTGASVSTNVDWNGTSTVSSLKSGASYSFMTPAITYNTYTCQPTFTPSTLVATNMTPYPPTRLTYTCSTTPQGTPVSLNGRLKVCGTQLCNEANQPIQLKGMSSHGIQWYGWQGANTNHPCLTPASLDTLAYQWNASLLRVSLYIQEGGYETNPTAFTNQVHTLIEEATKRGIYVLVDWHVLTPGDPNYNLERAKTFFTDIATAHKDKKNVLYEIANEPNGVTWSRIKTYAEAIIPVIRAIDSKSVILVGTAAWSSLGLSDGRSSQDIIDAPVNATNIMYTFHFYAASHRDDYLNEVDRASNVLPIFASEFGTQTYSGDGANDFVMADKYLQLFARKKIGWSSWSYSDDAGSSAVWKTGTCPSGPWTDGNLKAAGAYIKANIKN